MKAESSGHRLTDAGSPRCPHCGGRIEPFKSGGGRKTAERCDVPLLAELPLDPEVVANSDAGMPYVLDQPASPTAAAYASLIGHLLKD